jgi:hypothetical protein
MGNGKIGYSMEDEKEEVGRFGKSDRGQTATFNNGVDDREGWACRGR